MRLARLPILMLVSATLLCGQIVSLCTATSVHGSLGRQQRTPSADLLTPDDSTPHEESPQQPPAESAPCLGEHVEIESKDIATDFCLARVDHAHAPGMVAELHSRSELVSTSGMALYGMHRLQI